MDIPNQCNWNAECIVNSVASLLLNSILGRVPRELIRDSAFTDSSKCSGDFCELVVNDLSVLTGLSELSIKEGFIKALRYLGLNDVVRLIQLAIDLGLEAGVHAINEYLEINIGGDVGPSINELLGMALYSVGSYDQALARLNAAEAGYERLNETERANFIRGMSKVVKAEELRVKALRLHDEGKHDEEENVIKESSRLYVTSATIFKSIPTLREARVNEIISMADSAEILANYYFTHGIIDKAMQYYAICRDNVNNNLRDIPQDYLDTVKIKGDLCDAFYSLCNALENNNWVMYEKAGDEFLELIERGLIDELTTEGAVLSYKGALDIVENVDDAVRIYSKYIRAVNKYFDLLVDDRYGGFNGLLNEVNNGNYEEVAKAMSTDINTLKLYIFSKALIEVAREEGYDENEALEIMSYIAGLGLDIAVTSKDEIAEEMRPYIDNEELMGRILSLLEKAMKKWNSWVKP